MKKQGRMRSLNHQIAAIFIGLLLLSILGIQLINTFFLEKYYIRRKCDSLLEAMYSLENLDTEKIEGDDYWDMTFLEDEEIPEEIRMASSRNNLAWVIITKENRILAHVGDNVGMLSNRLFGYAYELDQKPQEPVTLRETDSYIIQQVTDPFMQMDYVEMWGSLTNGNYFLIRTPLESIRESASISNNFYLIVGIVITIIAVLIVWFLTGRITKPISDLTNLSRRMTELDFDARYEAQSGNEIDVLGANFNQMSEQLEKTISELKSANNELEKDIQDKIKIDEMRKEFIDNVSHELKTPIALIQGYAEGLKDNISDDPESREFYVDVIMDESQKMNKLVKNLLTLNSLESGKDAVVMERFDLVSLVNGVLASMDIMIQQNQAEIVFHEEGPVYVWADEFKTEEVVTNYLSNALHHVSGDMQIEIRFREEGERLRVTVFNTGTPIPEEDLPKLWTKFFKVDKARTREYGGSGIGLSIVKAIMEGMNQEYGVKNYDNGVEFYFTLDRK